MTMAMVFCGGDAVSPGRLRSLPTPDLTIAADSGASIAENAGVRVDVLVGDMDSISPELLDRAHNDETSVEMHPPDKDRTDLALALASAVDKGAESVTVVGGGGGRLDHLLGNVGVIGAAEWREYELTWVLEDETAYPVHRERVISTTPGQTFSLIALSEDATDIDLAGGRWQLRGATLPFGSSQGISNVAEADEIEVRVGLGILMVVVREY